METKILKTINPEDVSVGDTSDWTKRTAVRAVVFDGAGLIGLEHVKKLDHYKLPGGGVEEGESFQEALLRECEEELGVKIKVVREVGSTIEYRAKYKLCQTSHCFVAETASEKGISSYTEDERTEWFETVWVIPEEALKLLSLGKTADYEGRFHEERDYCFLTNALKGVK